MKVLAVLRKRQGLTQIELAKRLGVTQPEVSFWENGYGKPSNPEVREGLKDLFGVADVEELFLDYEEYLTRKLTGGQHQDE